MSDELVQFLSGVSLFENLSETALQTLAARGAELGFRRGDLICRKGDPGQSMFIITSGIFEVFIETDGKEQILNQLRKGDYFGEMALLTGLPRSASVRSLAETRVFGLTKEDFEDICRANVDIAMDIIKTLSLRLAHSNVVGSESATAKVFVLLSLEPHLGKSTLAANLAAAMAAHDEGTVALFDPNLASNSLARLFSLDETSDLAAAIVSQGHIDLSTALREVRPTLVMLPPQRAGGAVLQEYHHHIPFQALRDHASVVVVDSSSTMAAVNREIIKTAEMVLLMVPASNDDLAGTLRQVERMILGPANVDLSRVRLVVVPRDDETFTPPTGEVGAEVVVLPEAPETVAETPLLVETQPESSWSKAIVELSQSMLAGHLIELYVPVTPEMDADVAKSCIREARKRCPELLHATRATQSPPADVPNDGIDVFLVLHGNCSADDLRVKMARLLDTAAEIKEELQMESLFLRVDGRVDTI